MLGALDSAVVMLHQFFMRSSFACAAILFLFACGSDGGAPNATGGGPGDDGTGASDGGDGAIAPHDGGATNDGGSAADAPMHSPIDVCKAKSGDLAWNLEIPARGALTLVDVVAGPTDDVIVADVADGASFEQHRWSSAGAPVSVHTDDRGAYTGTLFTSGLFVDASNAVFYGMLMTGMPQGQGSAVQLVFTRLGANGTPLFTAKTNGTTSAQPTVKFLQVGGDATNQLHGAFTMSPKAIADGVYCYDNSGGFLGASAVSLAAGLVSGDFTWPTPDNGLVAFEPVTANASFGCGTLSVPSGGGVALVKLTASGSCVWNKLLALPKASVQSANFRVGVDGSLNAVVAYTGTIDFGGGPLHAGGASALAIARFDSNGNLAWAKSFPGASFTVGSLGVNARGTMIVTSRFSGAVDLGHGAIAGDTLLAALDSSGNVKWTRGVTVGQGKLVAAAGTCGFALATSSTSVDLGYGAIAHGGIGVATLGL